MSPLIEPEVLATRLNDCHIVILDVRFDLASPFAGKSLYDKNHIPGAQFADLEDDLSGSVVPGATGRHPLPDPETFAERIRQWGINADSHVIVYDDSGHAMAARAWWQLRWMGVSKVSVVHGGYRTWVGGCYPTSREKKVPSPGQFQFAGHALATVAANDILQKLGNNGLCLLDARSEERFAGTVEPIDAKAGHIPGAICHPFSKNMNAEGRFLSPELLRGMFTSIVPEGVIPVSYCGSGVTACHNMLAMTIAGLPEGQLYPGSWSEWITDKGRPIGLLNS